MKIILLLAVANSAAVRTTSISITVLQNVLRGFNAYCRDDDASAQCRSRTASRSTDSMASIEPNL